MKIKVSAKHIQNGIPCDGHQCPVALALIEAGFKTVYASQTAIHVDGRLFNTPREVAAFMDKADASWILEPISFELEGVTPK